MALPELDDDLPLNDEPKSDPGAADSLGPIGGGMRDDFTAAAEEAFPDIAGDPGRVEALKSAIRICLEEDQAGGYDEKGGGKKEKPKGGLALIFGAPKKK